MARQARIKNEFGIFYIQQTSSQDQLLFRNEVDRQHFLDLVKHGAENFQFELISYCVLSDSEYHMVLKLNGSDLSKIMKSINISYAMYRKESHQLFKDRYKSQWIEGDEALAELMSRLHCEEKALSHWNWLCARESISNPSSPKPCQDCIKDIETAQKWIQTQCDTLHLTFTQVLKDKGLRNEWILQIRKKSTLSLKEIGELFGGISESSVCKIIKDCH